jgi:site-specific DNA-cytosine methylase
MSHVDLCSGIGGFALGFEWAGLSKPVLFCDIEPWSRKVFIQNIGLMCRLPMM